MFNDRSLETAVASIYTIAMDFESIDPFLSFYSEVGM